MNYGVLMLWKMKWPLKRNEVSLHVLTEEIAMVEYWFLKSKMHVNMCNLFLFKETPLYIYVGT